MTDVVKEHTLPDDYEECGECGFDHEYDPVQAIKWHKENPCSYCAFDRVTGTHQPHCTTQATLRGGMINTANRIQCAECTRMIKPPYKLCLTCLRSGRRR